MLKSFLIVSVHCVVCEIDWMLEQTQSSGGSLAVHHNQAGDNSSVDDQKALLTMKAFLKTNL